jgi:tetratricopeptide (TPR) repeat protein
MLFIAERRPALLASAILSLSLVGCATGPKTYDRSSLTAAQEQVIASKPTVVQQDYRNLYEEGRRNKVLNLMEIGLKAYRAGHLDEARAALDRARVSIESIYADDDAARKARSVWYEEAEKDFKGEPYERSMVYLYLGLIFLEQGDYGNARASFISGLLQDAFAEEEQNSADFAALIYLAGWAALRMDSNKLAEEHFQELMAFRPDAPIPADDHNALLIVETGQSPRKLGDGVGHYQLVYRRGKDFPDVGAQWQAGETWETVYPMEDIYFQASTRGGRAIDRIVEGQVQYKTTTRDIGTNLSSVSQNSLLAGASASAGGVLGAGFAAISLVSVAAQGMSAAANVRADIRYWEALPDTLHIIPLRAEPGQQVTVRFLDKNGQPIPGLTDTTEFRFDGRGQGLALATSRRP